MSEKTWLDEAIEDEYFHIAHGFSSESVVNAFKEEHGQKIVFPIIYAFDTEEDGSLVDGCYSKSEIISIIEDKGGILFEYEPQGESGGNPEFTVIIPKDQKLLETITLAVYQETNRYEYLKYFDFCEIDSCPIVEKLI